MKAPLLSVEKIEFLKIGVDANSNFDGQFSHELHQLDYKFKGVKFVRQVQLSFPDEDLEDPRYFSFSLRLILLQENQSEDAVLPYNIDVQAVAYMHYRAKNHNGADRFRAVRATGYSILYGAIREMVSNLTSRGPHGMWMLPAADFNEASQDESLRDEAERIERLERLAGSIAMEPTECSDEKPKNQSDMEKGK